MNRQELINAEAAKNTRIINGICDKLKTVEELEMMKSLLDNATSWMNLQLEIRNKTTDCSEFLAAKLVEIARIEGYRDEFREKVPGTKCPF